MSGHDTAVTVAKVLTIITTLMLRVALLPDFNRWRKNRNTGEMSVMPCVLLYTNCYVVMFYAYAINDIFPLLFVVVIGVIAGAILAYFFYRWTDYKRETMRILIGSFVVCGIMTIYSVLALSGQTGQTHDAIETTMGYISATTTILMYASPMATIINVIRTKTASSMPFTMGVVVVCNSVCWIFYTILVYNPFILIPNICGFTLGFIQLVLTFIYPSATLKIEGDNSADVSTLSVAVLPIDYDHSMHFSSKKLPQNASPSYAAMRSPLPDTTKLWGQSTCSDD
ncbi:3-like protein [Plasmopara halstedii]|uniref:Sugar transporter SWEET1 n=1 Tax=Plasmopara halstedii TaxID=4781 RepID=A0A0P1ABB7_PLAHL|nr:3-like protein [Plasmopara halstedii]CEG38060.1 3-like protein [Plasmopara halstedii]|eukprot:XP_024574429.1 3-like protein [Plasmopara halstedii]